MARHLIEIQAKTRLSLGRSIAQFLSCQHEPDYTVLKWLTISKGRDHDAYCVHYIEVFGDEDDQEIDIVELTPVDPDDCPCTTRFDTAEEALAFAAEAYGALAQQYVAESMINEEYASYLKEENKVDDNGSAN